jgi:thiamine kinase-like enzyme
MASIIEFVFNKEKYYLKSRILTNEIFNEVKKSGFNLNLNIEAGEDGFGNIYEIIIHNNLEKLINKYIKPQSLIDIIRLEDYGIINIKNKKSIFIKNYKKNGIINKINKNKRIKEKIEQLLLTNLDNNVKDYYFSFLITKAPSKYTYTLSDYLEMDDNEIDSTFFCKKMNIIIKYLNILYKNFGFVHCDLHLGNILYDEHNDKLYIYDFDLSILKLNSKLINNFVIETVYNINDISFALFNSNDIEIILEILHSYDYYRLLFEDPVIFFNIKSSLKIGNLKFKDFYELTTKIKNTNINEDMVKFYKNKKVTNIDLCLINQYTDYCMGIIIGIYLYSFINPDSILYKKMSIKNNPMNNLIKIQKNNLKINNDF